jgi:hypothetical protein
MNLVQVRIAICSKNSNWVRGQPRIERGASRIFDFHRRVVLHPEARIIPLDHYPEDAQVYFRQYILRSDCQQERGRPVVSPVLQLLAVCGWLVAPGNGRAGILCGTQLLSGLCQKMS